MKEWSEFYTPYFSQETGKWYFLIRGNGDVPIEYGPFSDKDSASQCADQAWAELET